MDAVRGFFCGRDTSSGGVVIVSEIVTGSEEEASNGRFLLSVGMMEEVFGEGGGGAGESGLGEEVWGGGSQGGRRVYKQQAESVMVSQ